MSAKALSSALNSLGLFFDTGPLVNQLDHSHRVAQVFPCRSGAGEPWEQAATSSISTRMSVPLHPVTMTKGWGVQRPAGLRSVKSHGLMAMRPLKLS